MSKETIAAIATGLTDSGIGIIRISGSEAIEIGGRLFRTPSGKKNADWDSHKLYYGYVVDPKKEKASEKWTDSVIDEVMAVAMKAPRSFTGEDTVEIQCHGGVLVMRKILAFALENGARLAEPGEFTKRAFLSGRIDLSRAEAVMDVIQSQNEYALSASVRQLNGRLSEQIKKMRAGLIYEIALIESALDDPEHISLDGYSGQLYEKLGELIGQIDRLAATAENGRLIKEGIRTVIVGKPNAGKSSLLNLLSGEERAIVTDIAGTTRDALEETITLDGISFQMIDTAGIRHTDDLVEKIGVERAVKYAENADLIIYVVDSSVDLDDNDRRIISMIKDKKFIVLLNKSDLSGVVTEKKIKELLGEKTVIKISAKEGSGLELFEQTVKDMFFHGKLESSQENVILNMRHKEALLEASEALRLVKKSIDDGMPEDFLSIDLMSAYSALGKIIGEEVDDDLIEEIFRKFCLGK